MAEESRGCFIERCCLWSCLTAAHWAAHCLSVNTGVVRERQRQLFHRWKEDCSGLVWAMHHGSLNRYNSVPLQCLSNRGLGKHQGVSVATGDVIMISAILFWWMSQKAMDLILWLPRWNVGCRLICSDFILQGLYSADHLHRFSLSQLHSGILRN